MPWELFERFVNATRTGGADSEVIRARFSSTFSNYGWVAEQFWPALDDITPQYFLLYNDLVVSNVKKEPARGEPVFLSAESDRRQSFCDERLAALDNARAKFGRETFDRFLYEVIAPGVTVFADVPMTAADIRHISGGCR